MLTDQPTPEVDPVPEENAELAELIRRRVELKQKLLAKIKSCGIAAYRPHWKQHLFHSAGVKRRGLFAGNRFGKSQANGAETAAWMMGERPWYRTVFPIYGIDIVDGKRVKVIKAVHEGYDDHPLVHQGIPSFPTKQLIVCTNWDMVHKIWTSREADRPGKIWQFLPDGWATWSTNHEGVINEIYGKNGSYLCFMSVDAFKKNKMVAESSDWDRVAFDEPGPEKLWVGCSRGLTDRKGQGDFTLTGIEEMWIFDRFEADGSDPEVPIFPVAERFSIKATMLDNPHLTDDAIALFVADLTEDEKQCRIHGHPMELTGLIYKEFHFDRHFLSAIPEGWRDWHLPPKEYIMYVRIDTHPVTSHAVSFFAVGPSEIPIQCYEIWYPCDAEMLAKLIKDYLALTGCFLGGIKVEPAAWIKDASTRTVSIAKTLAANGLYIRPASKDLNAGILAVRAALRNNKILFTPNCRRTRWEFARYRYDPETGKPVDENDHFMENLYRLIIDKPRFFNPDRADVSVPDETFETADLSTNV